MNRQPSTNLPRFSSSRRRSRFLALELAFEAVSLARPIVDRVRRHDKELFSQLQRALTRTVLALGEGARRSGGNQQVAYRRARGEANEALIGVQLAIAWGYIDGADCRAVRRMPFASSESRVCVLPLR